MSSNGPVETATAMLGSLARRDEPIGRRTTYRVGGCAACFVQVSGHDELLTVAAAIEASGVDVLVIGKGSNLLISDRGFPGLVITLGEGFAELSVDVANGTVEAGGALALPTLARRCAAQGVAGLEWAVGIPGSVGGAVRMNAGGHGAETVDRLVDAEIFRLGSGELETVPASDLGLGYRRSGLTELDLVCSARFAVEPGDPDAGAAEIDRIVAWRRANQPGGRNGGSVFANPPGDFAGRLIEAAGMKGARLKSAFVSDKHANFFQVDEGGAAHDVAELIEHVRTAVVEHSGVVLTTELRLVGFGES